MIERPFWIERINQAWQKATIVWLTGVRRIGKTTLAKSFTNARYLNCDLPSTVELMTDPERMLGALRGDETLILDEIHQLPDPSRILKIAADAFPQIKVLATGSSTFSATKKFRDSLSGRKRVVHLVPILHNELKAFGVFDIRERLLKGGLPQALMSQNLDMEFYAEWLDSYYARDVQELFRVEKRSAFLKLLELILRNSGSLTEFTTLSKYTGLTRPTVTSYLDVLQITHAVTLLRPFSAGGRREIIAQPKIYGFDTGFVAHAGGLRDLRSEDCGLFWEHIVLEALQSQASDLKVHFWRDKQQREVDFAIPRARGVCDVIECKWDSASFDLRGLKAFRENYPKGSNFVVSPQVIPHHTRTIGGFELNFTNLEGLMELLHH